MNRFLCLLAISILIVKFSHAQQYTTDAHTVGLWHLNETSGTLAADSSGNTNDGSVTGTTIVDGKFGKARSFGGGSEFISVSDNATFDFTVSKAFTAECWAKIDTAPSSEGQIFGKWGPDGGSGNEFSLTRRVSGLQFAVAGNHQTSVTTTLGQVPLGEWIHIACVWDGNTQSQRLYINGVIVQENTSAADSLAHTGTQFRIGYNGVGGIYKGLVDEVRLSNRVRQPWEFDVPSKSGLIASYAFKGNAKDESGNGNNGIAVGATLTSDRFGSGNSAYHFNGTSYVLIPELFPVNQNAFTISAWVKPEAFSNIDQTIFYKGAIDGEVGFGLDGSDSTWGFGVKLSDYSWHYARAKVKPELNHFYNVVVRYQRGNALDLWVDGTKVDSSSIPALDLVQIAATPGSSMGSVYAGTLNFWHGTLDDISIYGRALGVEEIQMDSPVPTITSISDIQKDQGGKVRLTWDKSTYDTTLVTDQIVSYGVWRKIPAPGNSVQRLITPMRVMNDTLGILYDYLGSVAAVQSPQYNFVASTLSDSSASGTHTETYLITAHSANPNKYWISNASTGYSVDNLPPIPPSGLIASIQGDSLVRLDWNSPTDPDVVHYEIHRSAVNGFVPNALTNIGLATGTEFTDSLPNFGKDNYYRIIAVDVHDNASLPSSAVGLPVTITQTFGLRDKWNMVSIPLTLSDYTKTILYPSAISNAFAYEGSYVAYGTLKNATGYWIKFNGLQSVPFAGLLRNLDTVEVNTGWNMIGSISTPLAAQNVISIPGNMTTSKFFGYSGSYQTVDTIKPGLGYWVKVNQSGKLILSTSLGALPETRIRIASTNELPPTPPGEITSKQDPLPTVYALQQNFPNPWNPVTSIKYALSENVHVTLKVYDVLGRTVSTLVDEDQPAGYKSVEFNGAQLPSGIYYYRLTAGSFTEIKKMILLK